MPADTIGTSRDHPDRAITPRRAIASPDHLDRPITRCSPAEVLDTGDQ